MYHNAVGYLKTWDKDELSLACLKRARTTATLVKLLQPDLAEMICEAPERLDILQALRSYFPINELVIADQLEVLRTAAGRGEHQNVGQGYFCYTSDYMLSRAIGEIGTDLVDPGNGGAPINPVLTSLKLP
jgi:hypothetical protein